MRRREFITLLGSAVTWPLAARTQQVAMPVIGVLTSRGSDDSPQLMAAVRQGLKDTGFVEGQNIAIEYRFAGNESENSKKWSWLKAWAMQIARRRGIKKAIVALARRLAVIMHRIWVDGTEFRWTREAAAA
jgi:hypothetical protein